MAKARWIVHSFLHGRTSLAMLLYVVYGQKVVTLSSLKATIRLPQGIADDLHTNADSPADRRLFQSGNQRRHLIPDAFRVLKSVYGKRGLILACLHTNHLLLSQKERLSLWQALEDDRLWGIEASTFSRHPAHRWRWGCQPYHPTVRRQRLTLPIGFKLGYLHPASCMRSGSGVSV
jgi:hypothetical protein